jgi:hypothetical protein
MEEDVRTWRTRAGSGVALTPPKNTTFWIAVVMGVLGIVLQYNIVHIAALSPYSFLLLAAAFGLLVAGCASRGL